MEIYLIRHTKPDIMPGICYGKSDIMPAESFQEETGLIKVKIKDIKFDAVFSSPLKRCSVLADALFESYIISDLLTEMNFGRWEGVSWEAVFQDPEGEKWFDDYLTYPCPEGESFQDLCNRVKEFTEFMNNKDFKRVALVTHAGIIRAFRILFEGIDPESVFSEKLDYGEIVIVNLS